MIAKGSSHTRTVDVAGLAYRKLGLAGASLGIGGIAKHVVLTIQVIGARGSFLAWFAARVSIRARPVSVDAALVVPAMVVHEALFAGFGLRLTLASQTEVASDARLTVRAGVS